MKYFHKTVSPPPYCIYEILIQIFYRKFRDKIKIRQNSVNHHQSHPKFKFSTILVQWTPKIWGKLPSKASAVWTRVKNISFLSFQFFEEYRLFQKVWVCLTLFHIQFSIQTWLVEHRFCWLVRCCLFQKPWIIWRILFCSSGKSECVWLNFIFGIKWLFALMREAKILVRCCLFNPASCFALTYLWLICPPQPTIQR